MGYLVTYDRNISVDVPIKWAFGEVIDYKRVITRLENAGIDYFDSLKEAKECAETKKKVVNRNYYNIRIYQGSKKDFDLIGQEPIDTDNSILNKLEIVYRP